MACYQYRQDLINKRFQTEITRDCTAEPSGLSKRRLVPMINLPGDYSVDDFDRIIQARKINLNEGDVIYYHGTDAVSAASILKSGIDLTKSAPRQDFSNGCGFYVTNSLKRAVTKAGIRAAASDLPGRQGAIIVFTISKRLQKEKDHLTLTLDTEEDRMIWENIIRHYRFGEVVPDVVEALKNMKFIQGPAAHYGIPYRKEKLEACRFTQTCLLDKDYAKRFGRLNNIAFVMFFSDQPMTPPTNPQWSKFAQEQSPLYNQYARHNGFQNCDYTTCQLNRFLQSIIEESYKQAYLYINLCHPAAFLNTFFTNPILLQMLHHFSRLCNIPQDSALQYIFHKLRERQLHVNLFNAQRFYN